MTSHDHDYCHPYPERFLREEMTSRNAEMDKLIHDAQLKTDGYYNHLEWIPFDRLIDIKPIGEGGFANVYSATWLDGKPEFYRKKRQTNLTEAFASEVIEYY